MNKIVTLMVNGIEFKSVPVSMAVAQDLIMDMSNLVRRNMAIIDAPMTTPADGPDFVTSPENGHMAPVDVVKADQFVNCNVRAVVEQANANLENLRALDIPADEKHILAQRMDADNRGLDRWQRAAWVLVNLEITDQKVLDGDVNHNIVVNGGFPTVSRGNSDS